MADVPGRPDWGVLRDMVSDLRKATADLPNLQQRMLSVTGTAWSPDGMIKAVVGPRVVRQAYDAALRRGYLWHEFGDSSLLLRS